LGETVYREQCAGCHNVIAGRAPSKDVLSQMSVNRILRTLDFGTMMNVAYRLDRTEREAVAEYLGVVGEDRSPPPSAYCEDRTVHVPDLENQDWNGWSPTLTNTRFQSAPGLAADQVVGLTLKWAFAFDGDVNAFAPPAVLGEQMFVGSAGGSIYALNAKTGCLQWHYQADGPVRTAMVVAPRKPLPDGAQTASGTGVTGDVEHVLLFGDQAGGFYAVGAETGELLWKRRPEMHESTKLTGTPLAHEGVVYVPVASWEESRPLNPRYECCTFRGSVVAYRIADGEQLFKSLLVLEQPRITGETDIGVPIWGPSGAGTWSAPTLDAKRRLIYVTTGNNYTGMTAHSDAVVALSLDKGEIVWSNQLTAGDEANLYCMRREEGCPGADYDFGASAILETLPDGRHVLVVGQKSGMVYALDPDNDGKQLWQARVGEGGINGGVQWGMASDGQNVYAAVSDLARRPRAEADAFDPRPNDVDPTKGGGLTALSLLDGRRVWYAAPPACSPSQAVCSPAQPAAVTAMPGAVFSGAVDGHLRAFSTEDGRILWDFDTARVYGETVNGIPGRGGSIDGAGPVIAGGMVYATSGYGRNGGMPGNVLLAFGLRE
jgi:polyvinyl alcohol dehydrogenase (cytochrome)